MESWRVKAKAAEPLRDSQQIEQLREYLLKHERRGRMYALLVTCGCNLGLRASDLGQLAVGHFRDKTHVEIKEIKTGKERKIFINEKLRKEVDEYLSQWFYTDEKMLLFAAQGKMHPIDVKHIHRVVKRSCRALGFEGNYGSHTLRKTFAYHAYKLMPNLTFLRDVLRHADAYVTKIYVGELEGEKITRNEAFPTDVCCECKESDCVACVLQDAVIAKLML